MKKYTFQMTKEEVWEFGLRAVWEQQLLNRSKWLLILVVVALECIIVPWEVPLVMVLLLLGILVALIAKNYFVMKEQLCGKTRTLWVEDGMLKLDVEGEWHGEIPCNDITVVRKTRRLLMLGCRRASKVIGWYPILLRVFENEQERDRFVESVRNPQAQNREGAAAPTVEEREEASAMDLGAQPAGDHAALSSEKTGQEYLRLSFQVGEEEWVRMMADATEIIQADTWGEQKKRGLIWAVLAAVFFFFSCWAIWRFPNAGRIISIVSFIGVVTFLTLLRNLLENPEKRIRAQIRRGTVRNDAWGNWEISVTEMGISQSLSEKNGVMMPWESLFCMVETDTELFFYQKDKRRFLGFPKRCMEGREQIESLKGICREKQLEILVGKRKKYVPNWLFPILTAIVMVGYIAANVWPLFGDSRENEVISDVPFGEQVSVLRSFGFTIPEEMEETLGDHIEENGMASYVERYPYIWLLNNLAWADEDWADWFPDGAEVFWFDFEGWDISTDYIMVLEGMRELSTGSILDDVENIREDTENVKWERGTGTITVSLEWNNQEYSWKMDMNNDWIDAKVLGIYNGLLEKEGIPERFYMTGDDGQGALVLYCTEEWASAFEKATGLNLEAYMVKKGW